MRSFDELTRYVLSQRDERLAKQKKRRRKLFTAVPVLAAACVAAVIISAVSLTDVTDPSKTESMIEPAVTQSRSAAVTAKAAVTKLSAAESTKADTADKTTSDTSADNYYFEETAQTEETSVTTVTEAVKPIDIYEKLPSFVKNGRAYSLTEAPEKQSVALSEKLFDIEGGEAYSLDGFSEEYVIGLKFYGLDDIFLYENESYSAQTFSSFKRDTGFDRLSVNAVYIGSTAAYGATDSILSAVSACDGEATAVTGSSEDSIFLDCTVADINENGGIIVTKDGYLTAYFLGKSRNFYVGEELYTQLISNISQ